MSVFGYPHSLSFSLSPFFFLSLNISLDIPLADGMPLVVDAEDKIKHYYFDFTRPVFLARFFIHCSSSFFFFFVYAIVGCAHVFGQQRLVEVQALGHAAAKRCLQAVAVGRKLLRLRPK